MKILRLNFKKFEKFLEVIKKGNPPDEMNKEEWYKELHEALMNAYYKGDNIYGG